MKKLILILFLTFSSLVLGNCPDSSNFISGKSFFSVQPLFRPASPEMVSIAREQLKIYDDTRIRLDVSVYGGQSADSDKLARYFMPFGKRKIIAGELGSEAVRRQRADVIANYFGVLTDAPFIAGDPVGNTFSKYTFESELTFNPKQTFAGAVFTYRHHISRYTDKGFWFELVVPLQYVKNDMGLCEKIIKKGGPNGNDPQVPKGFVGSMKAAFRQKKWRFGKIDGAQSRFGFADPYFRFGYIYMKEETHHLTSYVGLSAPTGNVPNGEFVFEAVVGNGGHATVFLGNSGGFRVWSRCEKTLNFEFDTLGTLGFSNEQIRSFDMKDKTWSRYMWVYLDQKTTHTSPGINVFSQRVEVVPGTSRDLTTAMVYKDNCLQAEVGYHFYSRQNEEVKLPKGWNRKAAIAAITNNCNVDFIAGRVSRDNATINEYLRIENDSIDGNEIFKPIDETDLDLESAAHPTVISHTGYLTISYNWDCAEYPMFVGVGGLYDFSTNNAALSRWMLWARFGISF